MNRKCPVSIIITTKNEAGAIGILLSSINKQSYKNIEVILIDNSSYDGTLEIARQFLNVKIYSLGPERSAQRNLGARKSKGKYLLFLDADMELTSDVIKDCVEVAEKENLSGVVIPEQSVAINFWGKVKAFERSFYSEKGDPVTDAARFFLRQVFFKVGGYDESITGPEDWDLPDRIRERGFKIGRSSEKIYHHEQDISLIILFKKKFYYGLNAHKYLTKHNIPVFSPKTIYFLRPLFYKSWVRLLKHPILSLAMIWMLLLELVGGGLGYIAGRIKE
ncbi:glycosyltransferase [Candidatus Daviesbacteria bacterium]|nr:glycosyltransferase [Candidatus Daviesbacteria bacterium]